MVTQVKSTSHIETHPRRYIFHETPFYLVWLYVLQISNFSAMQLEFCPNKECDEKYYKQIGYY